MGLVGREGVGSLVPRNAAEEKQNWGVRFCCGVVGSLMVSRGGGGGGGEGEDGASEVGRLDHKSCATLLTGQVRWGSTVVVVLENEVTDTSSARRVW